MKDSQQEKMALFFFFLKNKVKTTNIVTFSFIYPFENLIVMYFIMKRIRGSCIF